MAKGKKIALIMSDSNGIEWVSVELSESAAKRLVKAYQAAGLGLRAQFREVAAA
jgi:hypothetical protein